MSPLLFLEALFQDTVPRHKKKRRMTNGTTQDCGKRRKRTKKKKEKDFAEKGGLKGNQYSRNDGRAEAISSARTSISFISGRNATDVKNANALRLARPIPHFGHASYGANHDSHTALSDSA
ncbi:hypothetical protein PUN28_018520 [Cardiocondyla obscurior]|uniref:Uncharacterized protein n=1 Tax=Cardiocondyla obscurior TaxID=286306 RepID=A0AAW2EGA7_9HYME